jgi:hypothetical protein
MFHGKLWSWGGVVDDSVTGYSSKIRRKAIRLDLGPRETRGKSSGGHYTKACCEGQTEKRPGQGIDVRIYLSGASGDGRYYSLSLCCDFRHVCWNPRNFLSSPQSSARTIQPKLGYS